MKEILLDEETQQLVETIEALACPARIRILEILAEHPRLIVADIVKQLPLAQATVSQHLAVLRDAKLIVGMRESSGHYWHINYEMVSQFSQQISAWTLQLAVLGIGSER